MNRKQRRALNKLTSKDNSKELADKITQFGNLPDMCLTCEKPFDKKNKKMVRTWSVVVRTEDTVRLYCPECWDMANKIISDFKKEIENNASE